MPTSATGADRRGHRPARPNGFTLVELMVVLVTLGLATAAVVIAIPDPAARLGDEADSFAARLVTARDLAVVGGHDIAVRIDAQGYDFSRRDDERWQAITAKALQPRRWGTGVVALNRIDGGETIVFDTTGLATPALVTLQRGSSRASVIVDAAGGVHVEGH